MKNKLLILCWKNNENREEVAWFFTPQEDQIKTTVCLALYKWAVHTTVCVPPPLIHIYISYIKCNVVTLYERILTCFMLPWADPNEFWSGTFYVFSHNLSSLCVIYPRERSLALKLHKRFFLVFLLSVEEILEANPNEFCFGIF